MTYEKHTVIFIVLQVSAIFAREEAGPRIIGGRKCSVSDYPFVVSILSTSLCGGSLLTLKWVLTAAHCVKPAQIQRKNMYVRSGFNLKKTFIQIRRGVLGVRHPSFNYRDLVNEKNPDIRFDLGLLMVDKPFDKTPYVDLARLPSAGFTSTCTTALALGAGKREIERVKRAYVSRALECVNLHIVNMSVCKMTWPRAAMDDSVLCTMEIRGGRDACKGDSGGPLVCRGFLVGIVSIGKGCGMAGISAIFTKVEAYLSFINRTILTSQGSKAWHTCQLLITVLLILMLI